MIEIKTKICTKCGKGKPATTEFFYKSKNGKYGFESRCKDCVKLYRINNIGKITEQRRKYREEHREEAIKRSREEYYNKRDWYKEYARAHRCELKSLVISHYGGRCAVCGETHLAFLTIDHINNNGSEHRKRVGMGDTFYQHLVSSDFPPGYQVLCWNHNYLKQLEILKSKWSNTKDAIRQRRATRRRKEKILNHYGRACVCCGETDTRVLGMDHINGGGSKHRKETGCGSGDNMNAWLIKNGFPAGVVQVMCFNCNDGKQVNGGTCPHEFTNL